MTKAVLQRWDSYQSLFRPDNGENLPTSTLIRTQDWKPAAFEKLARVAHFGSLMVSGLVAPNQNILWITDQDEIVPDERRHVEATRFIDNVQNHFLTCRLGRAAFGTTRSDNAAKEIEDVAAIPDFAAGALSEIVTSLYSHSAPNNILVPMDKTIPKKAQAIGGWLADSSHALKKLAFVIVPKGQDHFQAQLLRMELERQVPEYCPGTEGDSLWEA